MFVWCDLLYLFVSMRNHYFQFELHIRHAKSSARLVRILSSLDQKTGRALKKAPRLLTARQAALVEVMNVCTLVRRRRSAMLNDRPYCCVVLR